MWRLAAFRGAGRFTGPAAGLGLGGQLRRPCLVLHRVGFAWPACHHAAGALLPHHFTLAGDGGTCVPAAWAVSSLWHFPAGFPGSGFPTTLPCGVRTFLEGPVFSPAPAAAWPATTSLDSGASGVHSAGG